MLEAQPEKWSKKKYKTFDVLFLDLDGDYIGIHFIIFLIAYLYFHVIIYNVYLRIKNFKANLQQTGREKNEGSWTG